MGKSKNTKKETGGVKRTHFCECGFTVKAALMEADKIMARHTRLKHGQTYVESIPLGTRFTSSISSSTLPHT